MLVINRTPNTLTNLTVELSTMGDLRLVERPQSHTIGPLDSRNIRANIKVIGCVAELELLSFVPRLLAGLDRGSRWEFRMEAGGRAGLMFFSTCMFFVFWIRQVSSTETGHIFGTIVYENSSTAEKTYINLNDIQMDIMDYIKPASCSEESFRSMWAEFEWENKVIFRVCRPYGSRCQDKGSRSRFCCCCYCRCCRCRYGG